MYRQLLTMLLIAAFASPTFAHRLPFDPNGETVNCGLQVQITPNPHAKTWGPPIVRAGDDIVVPHRSIDEDGYTEKFYVIVLTATWCSHCKHLKPLVKEARAKGVKVYEFDVDQHNEVFKTLNVRSMPTVIYMNGGHEQHRFTGVKSRHTYLRMLRKIVKPDPNIGPLLDIDPESGIDLPDNPSPDTEDNPDLDYDL